MRKARYTISKEIAKSLQSEGWTLVETFYDNEYQADIYHLEKDDADDNKNDHS